MRDQCTPSKSCLNVLSTLLNSKIFIIDLVRPQDENSVEEIVNQSLGINFESDLFRQDFINSLKAAFTKEEIEELTTDRQGAYWNKMHPNHNKVVNQVLALREMLSQ